MKAERSFNYEYIKKPISKPALKMYFEQALAQIEHHPYFGKGCSTACILKHLKNK